MTMEEAIIELLLEIKSGNDCALLTLGNLYRKEGKIELAYKFYKRAVDRGVDNALDDHFITLCYKTHRLEEYKYYLNILSDKCLYDGRPWFLELLINRYIEEEEYEVALEFCKKAYVLKPKYYIEQMVEIYIHLYYYNGSTDNQFEIANKYIQESIRFGKPCGLDFLAFYYRIKGNYNEAIKYFKILNHTGSRTYYCEIGDLNIKKKCRKKAEYYYMKGYVHNETISFSKLGDFYIKTNKEKAIKYFAEGSANGYSYCTDLLEKLL